MKTAEVHYNILVRTRAIDIQCSLVMLAQDEIYDTGDPKWRDLNQSISDHSTKQNTVKRQSWCH